MEEGPAGKKARKGGHEGEGGAAAAPCGGGAGAADDDEEEAAPLATPKDVAICSLSRRSARSLVPAGAVAPVEEEAEPEDDTGCFLCSMWSEQWKDQEGDVGGMMSLASYPARILRLSICLEDMEETDHIGMPQWGCDVLSVMAQDGSKRPAASLYEWVQQFCVEQCAALIALEEHGHDTSGKIPCALAEEDGFTVPQGCMGCGRWWTDGSLFAKLVRDTACPPPCCTSLHSLTHSHSPHPHPHVPLQVKDRRQYEMEYRAACVVISWQEQLPIDMMDALKPFIVGEMATTFPVPGSSLEDFMVRIGTGEYPAKWRRRAGHTVFLEGDHEDAISFHYCMSTHPMYMANHGAQFQRVGWRDEFGSWSNGEY